MKACAGILAAMVILSCSIVGCGGCESSEKPKGGSYTTSPSGQGTSFHSKEYGISFTYPAGWTPRKHEYYVLELSGGPDRTISLDLPELPPHIPGLIPLRLVKSGYIDDLKEKVKDPKIEEDREYQMPGASARLVRSTWVQDGKEYSETALLMVHSDRVYILRANSDAAGYSQTREVFDAIVKSVQWVK